MLRPSFKLEDAARAIEAGVSAAIAQGLRTGDICNPAVPAAKKVGTTEMGDAVVAAM